MNAASLSQNPPREFKGTVYMSLTVALGVLATPLELALPTCPGQIGFVLMLIPTFMAAFDGGHRSGFFTGLTGSVCICLAAWIANWGRVTGGLNLLVPIVMPVIWAVVLAGCGFWLGRCLDSIRQHAADLREQCNQHERAIYQLHKDSHEVAATAEQERVRRQQIEAQQLDFSRLLLNIQHLGRELSGHLEMQGVSRLATEAARKLLKVPSARLFLIDETTRDLVEMTPGREGDRFAGGRGMLGWSVRHRQIITAEDVAKNHELADLPAQDVATWQACAPLVFDNQVLGVLGIDTAEQKGKDFDRLLYIVASFSAVAVNNGRMFQRAQEQARRDGLTGLWNHATFQRRLAELLAEAKTSGRPVSMVLADVDFFKKFNDMHGHQAGDHVLRSVAALWQRLIPKSAMAARYGGEEFVFVLPGTDVGAAAEFAESLRFAVANETIEFDGTTLMVSASFGVAGWPTNGELPAQLIRSADMALYSAKRGGRNRVALAAPGEPPDIRRTEITSAQTLAGLSRSAHEA